MKVIKYQCTLCCNSTKGRMSYFRFFDRFAFELCADCVRSNVKLFIDVIPTSTEYALMNSAGKTPQKCVVL